MEEIWKDVVGYEGLYQVSNQGRLLRCERVASNNHLLPPKIKDLQKKRKTGYMGSSIVDKSGKSHNVLIHRLVAVAFIPNHNKLPQVDHIDGNKENNCVDNLLWCTAKENVNYPISIATRSKSLKIAQNNPQTISKKIKSSHKKKVNQFSLSGEFIKTYESLRDIQRTLGFNITNVTACAHGRKRSAYGYIWKFVES